MMTWLAQRCMENDMRRFTQSHWKRPRQEYCARGHEQNEANTRSYGTKRMCKLCAAISKAARKANA